MNRKKLFFVISLGFFAVLFFILNIRLIYVTDDWHYKFVFFDFRPVGYDRRIQSIGDIVESMKNYYLGSGGRVFSHSILQMILMFGKMFFNIINTTVFLLFILLIYKLSDVKNSPVYLALTGVLALFYMPVFGETCLWISGAVNYLWMTVIILTFLYCVKKEKRGLSLVLAFFSGFTNEATGGILIVFLVLQMLLKKEKLSLFGAGRMLLLIPGEVFILLSPGNITRADVVQNTKIFSLEVAFTKLQSNMEWLIENGYYILIFAILVILVVSHKNLKKFIDPISYLLAAGAGMVALSLSGTFIPRAHFLNVSFLIIAFLYSLNVIVGIFKEKPVEEYGALMKALVEKKKFITTVVTVAVSLFVVVFLGLNLYQFFEATGEDIKQVEMIEDHAARGENLKYRPVMHYRQGLFYPLELSCSKDYEADWQGEYYGIKIEVDVN